MDEDGFQRSWNGFYVDALEEERDFVLWLLPALLKKVSDGRLKTRTELPMGTSITSIKLAPFTIELADYREGGGSVSILRDDEPITARLEIIIPEDEQSAAMRLIENISDRKNRLRKTKSGSRAARNKQHIERVSSLEKLRRELGSVLENV